MFRDLLSSKLIQVGLVFFVVVVGGSLLYSWYAHRTTEVELAQTNQSVQQPEKNNKVHTAQVAGVPTETETAGFVRIPDETEALPNETETFDFTDAFLPNDFVSEETPAEDVPVSPFGLGPYPEVPEAYIADYGLPIWYEHNFGNQPETATHERNIELVDRVLIKLWKEGKDVLSGFYRYGKVYPLYPKSAYVKYYERIHDEGYSTGLTVIESPDFDIKLTIKQLQNGDIPAGYRIFDLDSSGLDPYTFLDL